MRLQLLPVSGGGLRAGTARLSEDEVLLVASFLDARSVLNALGTCRWLAAVLEQDDALWKRLYRLRYPSGSRPRDPSLPNAGSWRQALLRAVRNRVVVVVHSLGGRGGGTIRLEVSRRTTLFGLKKLLRQAQLERAGIALDDFELVDAVTEAPLGVQGFDALPPSDLSVLFVGSETILRSVRTSEAFRRMLLTNQRPAWRKTLLYVQDGLELQQVFVGPSGILQSLSAHSRKPSSNALAAAGAAAEAAAAGGPGHASAAAHAPAVRPGGGQATPRPVSARAPEGGEQVVGSPGGAPHVECCAALQRLGDGEVEALVQQVLFPGEWGAPGAPAQRQSEALSRLCELLAESNASIRYNAFKPFWAGSLHPLLTVALAPLTGPAHPPPIYESEAGGGGGDGQLPRPGEQQHARHLRLQQPTVSLRLRVKALAVLARQTAVYFLSKEFLVGCFARALLSSGFLAVFARIALSLFPLILRVQIKQVMGKFLSLALPRGCSFARMLIRRLISCGRCCVWALLRACSFRG
jgi:hypothetical protein